MVTRRNGRIIFIAVISAIILAVPISFYEITNITAHQVASVDGIVKDGVQNFQYNRPLNLHENGSNNLTTGWIFNYASVLEKGALNSSLKTYSRDCSGWAPFDSNQNATMVWADFAVVVNFSSNLIIKGIRMSTNISGPVEYYGSSFFYVYPCFYLHGSENFSCGSGIPLRTGNYPNSACQSILATPLNESNMGPVHMYHFVLSIYFEYFFLYDSSSTYYMDFNSSLVGFNQPIYANTEVVLK